MTLTVNSLGDNPQQPGIYAETYIPDQLIAGNMKLVTANGVLGSGTLQRGAILGQQTGTVVSAAGTNTGNGTIGSISKGAAVRDDLRAARALSLGRFAVIVAVVFSALGFFGLLCVALVVFVFLIGIDFFGALVFVLVVLFFHALGILLVRLIRALLVVLILFGALGLILVLFVFIVLRLGGSKTEQMGERRRARAIPSGY